MASVARDEDTLDPERVSAREMRVVFDAAFALMVVNFADRHIVVATFPQLQAEWGASDTQLHRLAERYGSGRVFLAGEAVYTVFLVYAAGLVVLLLGYTAGTVLFIVARRERNQRVYAPAELVPLAGAVGAVGSVVGAVSAVVGLATDLISI
jgi:hypothetical protein